MSDQAAVQPVPVDSRRVRIGRIVTWLVVAVILGLLGWGMVKSFLAQPQSGMAPDFSLTTFTGETYTLSQLRGQYVVVINFWASWCGPCEEEAPDLQAAWEAYRDRGVMFLGVDYVDSEGPALAFIERFGVTYPNGPDTGTRISDMYRIRGVPETFIVNRQGEITFFAQRPLTFDELSAEIEAALAE